MSTTRQAVFFGFSFAHHGPHTAFRGLAAALSDQIVIDATPPLPRGAPDWFAWRFNWRWLEWSERRVKRYFDEPERRVVHYFFPENTMRKAAAWKAGHGLIATCHQPLDRMKDLLRPDFAAGLRASDALVVQCSSHMADYRDLFPGARVECIPLGVDTTFFRRQGPPGDDKVRILTVGNWLRDYAVWARVVEAFADRPHAPVFTVVANPNTIERARGQLRKGAGGVRFLTGISDEALRDEYERATLFFLPLQDAMANDAILEALAMGSPTVVTDLSATRDYLGDAAVYVPRGDADAAIGAIEGLLKDPGTARAMGTTARRRAEALYAWEIVADQYRRIYRDVAEGQVGS